MSIRWLDIEFNNENHSDITFDNNDKVIKGYFLTTLNIDLENIPKEFLEWFYYLDINELSNSFSKIIPKEERVYLKKVVGSTYDIYSDRQLIQSFQNLKRATHYIKSKKVTLPQYKKQLHCDVKNQSLPDSPISFIEKEGKYYIYRNGNHRVIMYKIMYMARKYVEGKNEKDLDKIFYLNAMVYHI